MADISLRGYLKEIDELIERDQLDEAISHCRHILQVYPKHLDTYRLLGKSYLEAKRFGDAADIFQRVLSAVPDDFVSHIGMAIVREDEGNIDAAIWHMERAFETNPANPAIRQELSRLIGRRDGIEPHKIRLTRGALARQYAQGELLPQAIAELRSALQEDPDRPELEVLLAKMYWMAGQSKEARSISEQIIEKLPFSYDANRIMASIYESEGQSDKAGEHHRRLAAIEPYAAFSDSSSIDPSTVDANAVRIERSEWIAGQPLPSGEPGQPDWVSSLGVDLSTSEAEPVSGDDSPPWLSEIEHSARSLGESAAIVPDTDIPEDSADPEAGEAGIPDWMQEAGWSPSSGGIDEGPVSFSDDELEALDEGILPVETSELGEGELAPAEIPNWLQGKAPLPVISEAEESEEAHKVDESDATMPDWLSEIADEAEDVTPDPAGTKAADEPLPSADMQADPETDGPEVPSWIDDLSPGATSTIITWLGDRPETEASPEVGKGPEKTTETSAQSGDIESDDIPSWLDDIAEGDDVPDLDAAPTPDSAPSWLAGVAQAASQQATPIESPSSLPETDEPLQDAEDDWLENLRAADAQGAQVEEGEQSADWLEGVAETESPQGEAEEPGTPDWLRGVREPEETSRTPDQVPQSVDAPEWLRSEDENDVEPGAVRADVPDWLQGIADSSGDSDDFNGADLDVPTQASESPGWVKDFAGKAEVDPGVDDMLDPQEIQAIEAELSEATDPAEPSHEITPSGLGVEDELDDEEVFRWLESLADRQDSAAPPTSPDDSSERRVSASMQQSAPPDAPEASLQWLEDLASERGLDVDISTGTTASTSQEAVEEQVPPVASQAQPTPVKVEPGDPEETSPDWLRQMATAPADETVIAIPKPPKEEVPAQAAPTQPPTPKVETPAAPTDDQPEPEVPSWLDEAATIASDVPAVPAIEAAPEAPIAAAASPAATPAPEVKTPPQAEPQAAPEGSTKKAKRYKEPPTEAEILLQGARQALAAGDAGRALSDYKKMINRKQELDTVIEDLEEALDRYPNLPTMWQALGDAYMKADRLAEAIQAYQRGMEVA